MQPSSIGRRLGSWLLVIQPSSVRPSNSSSQPSFFSCSVSSLSAATAGEDRITIRKIAEIRMEGPSNERSVRAARSYPIGIAGEGLHGGGWTDNIAEVA